MNDLYDVFVCNSKEDLKQTNNIINYLEEHNIKCWSYYKEKSEIMGIGTFRHVLNECKVVLVINNKDSYKDNTFPWVIGQMRKLNLNKHIINYCLDISDETDLYLSHLADTFIGAWSSNAIENVCKTIVDFLKYRES